MKLKWVGVVATSVKDVLLWVDDTSHKVLVLARLACIPDIYFFFFSKLTTALSLDLSVGCAVHEELKNKKRKEKYLLHFSFSWYLTILDPLTFLKLQIYFKKLTLTLGKTKHPPLF